MPRKRELTFQPGTKGREGRWKKYYLGKVYYLGSGRAKSDHESYEAALKTWNKLRVALDARLITEPKPYEKEYQDVIAEWELVLSWAVQHGDDNEAVLAREKLAELRTRQERTEPPPIMDSDRLWSRFRHDQKRLLEIADLALDPSQSFNMEAFREAILQKKAFISTDPLSEKNHLQLQEVDPLRKAEIQWEDRLENQKRVISHAVTESLEGWIEIYLEKQRQRVEAGEMTAGRYSSVSTALVHFRDWAGAQLAVSSISGQLLTRFHTRQLELIASGKTAPVNQKGN